MIIEKIIQYGALVFLYSFVPYLIISIYKKDLPLPTKGRQYNYKGKRAIFLSLFFLVIFGTFLYKEVLYSDLLMFFVSLVIGFPIAFVLHGTLSQNKLATVVSDRIEPRKIEKSSLILWGIVGVFAGFISGGLISSGLGALFSLSHNFITVIFIFIFFITIFIVAWRGAKTTWM